MKVHSIPSAVYVFLVTLLVSFPSLAIDLSTKCNRTPPGTRSPKTSGDGGFKIHISGNPEKYVPGEVYTVRIMGQRLQRYTVRKFTSFMLIVESSSQAAYIYGPQSVGSFQLYPDILTRHSDDCPNAVVQTSKSLKTEIQVLWVAPPAGSGCVRFRATVTQAKDVWHMDDGELTKVLCEEIQESEDRQSEVIKECCACDEAKYEVTFEGLWSRQTHPNDFPANEWLTHFSDIIGASHSNAYRMWEYGGLASDGLRQVAEWGSTRTMESELKRQSRNIRTIIKARGLWYPDVNKKTFAVFRVDNKHHLMSLVSMLGPSPDWIVGVSAMELCTADCNWVQNKTLKLYPWDSGTDSGITYMSANSPTIPREKIRRITNSYPNTQKNPFYDPKGLPMKPLAKLTISRQRVYKKSCTDVPSSHTDHFNIFENDNVDLAEEDRPECAVSEWSEFSPCSVTCGKGIRTRTRFYRNPMKANMFQCNVQLKNNEMCPGLYPFCENGSEDQFFPKIEDPLCMTTDWTPWNPCSVSCGEGVRMRYRRFKNRLARKRCDTNLSEKEPCKADISTCPNTNNQIENSLCKVTEWSDWSPCSSSCGDGFRSRKRYFVVPAEESKDCNVELRETQKCVGEKDSCRITREEAKEICMLPSEFGPCRGKYPRFYYDKDRRMCMQFTWGGCRGNRNNFISYDECTKTCEYISDQLHGDLYYSFSNNEHEDNSLAKSYNTYTNRNHDDDTYSSGDPYNKVDCEYSEWSQWSSCSTSCGRGWKERKRTVKVQAENGGKPCSRKTIRRRKCKAVKCKENDISKLESLSLKFDPYEHYASSIIPSDDLRYFSNGIEDSNEQLSKSPYSNVNEDCVMGDWGPWSPCTHSCGTESLQQRARSIIVKARGTGTPCGPRLERRYCTLPPCTHTSRNW